MAEGSELEASRALTQDSDRDGRERIFTSAQRDYQGESRALRLITERGEERCGVVVGGLQIIHGDEHGSFRCQ
ncbi:MAG TPA: hypothetical protein VJV78_09255 [Polyangiales bacterium]|nr:hypothetical protein [Polyangiales bacterium]